MDEWLGGNGSSTAMCLKASVKQFKLSLGCIYLWVDCSDPNFALGHNVDHGSLVYHINPDCEVMAGQVGMVVLD